VIDHTLSWELARVGGMVAYVLVTASVIIGMLVSLKLRSARWPRWVTTELHRFVTLVALLFAVAHGIAVWIDPFTGFTPAEVLVPFASHYRPLWLAAGIVAGYLLLGVWASEYVRPRIGYAWWRRLHFLAFVVFVLATLHGIGSGSDTANAWGLLVYGTAVASVLLLALWRLLGAGDSAARTISAIGVLAAAGWLGVFTVSGPAQSGWNAIANDGEGSGASAAWLASHPSSPAAPTASFTADLVGDLVDENRLVARIDNGTGGTLDVRADDESATLSLSLTNGWSCSGGLTATDSALRAVCRATDGAEVNVAVSELRRTTDGGIRGRIAVEAPSLGG
jgi:DMSO/TMAO reductase YedYZ heme-binding membrane subunit